MSILETFETTTLCISRSDGGGQYVKGRYIPPNIKDVDVSAVVMPATAREIRILPEGRQDAHTLKIFTNEELFMNDQLLQTQADTFFFNGRKYEIVMVANWSVSTCLPHYESMAQLVDPQRSK